MRFRALVLFAAAVILAACSSSPTSPDSGGSLLKLAVGQTGTTAGGLTIEFVDVDEDSRCPVDVTCVWMGNAALALRTGVGGSTPQNGQLNTGQEPRMLDVQDFRIEIDRLLPEPRSDIQVDPDQYEVTLRITRR